MPVQVIATEGLFSPDAELRIFAELTELLLRLHELTGNSFMTPSVVGEFTTVPPGRSFVGGKPAELAIFELKAPAFVLTDDNAKETWIREGTDIIERAANGSLPRERIYANVVYAVDGLWGIGGQAYSNPQMGEAIAAAA